MELIEESDVLHDRVQGFAAGNCPDTFRTLALDIARFQARYSPGFARLVERHRSTLDDLDDIPALPTAAFKLTRVALHSAALDQVCFQTSGTTAADRGLHAMRRLDTYRALSVRFGHQALASALDAQPVVVALAPHPGPVLRSSLGCMMQFFMEEFAGVDDETASFGSAGPERWLIGAEGLNMAYLRSALEYAREAGRPLLLLATAFALVHLLERMKGQSLSCPVQTLVMMTGGFKGKSRSIPVSPFKRAIAELFGITEQRIVGEYGMTELSSQLYEGTAPGAQLRGPVGVYLPPPWLRVSAVDPIGLKPLPEGEVGLARFVDLGNIDSALAIVTEDLVRQREGGVELLGRAQNSTPRGCSLALEELLAANPSSVGA